MEIRHGQLLEILFGAECTIKSDKDKSEQPKELEPLVRNGETVVYDVPAFQRKYAWTNNNCEELFDDILLAHEKGKNHFLGNIVISNKGEGKYTVIDGQQRITTIFLLLKALSSSNKCTSQEKDFIENCLTNNVSDSESELKVKLKLKDGGDYSNFYNLIRYGASGDKKDSDLFANYDYLRHEIDENGNISELLDGIKRLEIVVLILNEDDEPQVVFEKINSTGKELTLSDKIRNYLLMNASGINDLHTQYWVPMENSLGDNLDGFFKDYLRYKSNSPSKSSNSNLAYQSFKHYVIENKLTQIDVLRDLDKYSVYYCAFLGCKTDSLLNENFTLKLSAKTSKSLNDLKITGQNTYYPFLFGIFDDYTGGRISEKTLQNVLSFLLKFLVRRVTLGSTDSLRGFFITLYRRIFPYKNSIDDKNYLDSIYKYFALPSVRLTNDCFMTDETFKKNLTEEKIYKKLGPKLTNYLLLSFENNKRPPKEKIPPSENISVEHILPQSRSCLKYGWGDMLGPKFDETRSKYLHTLGNLSLATENTEISNYSFDEKKKYYKSTETNGYFRYLYEYVNKKDQWTEKEILERAEILSQDIVGIFDMPKELKKYIDEECKGFDDTINIETKKRYKDYEPVSYSFMDEEYKYTDCKSMFVDVVEKLFLHSKKNQNKINEFADNQTVFGKRKQQGLLFSRDSNKLSEPFELCSSGIYLETAFNIDNTISRIKQIFAKLKDEENTYTLYLNVIYRR